VAIRRCSWCGKTLGVAPDVQGEFADEVCDLCAVKLNADSALSHALVAMRAIQLELERALAAVWAPEQGET